MNEIATGTQIEASAGHSQAKRETMQSLIEKGVEYCMPFYVDVHGIAKTKTVPVSHFDRMMRGSELFTGAALDGLGQGPHDDELAVLPDPDAVMQLPWRPNVAVIPGQLTYHEQPYPMCSRTVLAKQVERAAKMGLKFNLGIECETYIVRLDPSAHNGIAPNDPRDTIAKAAYDATLTLLNLEFLNEIVSSMNKLGWEVHSFDHEDANGQFEFDFAYADVMTMADRFVVWRMMMKELARKYGWESTMMAKPYADRTGSGAHFNMSLADVKTGKNVSGDASDKRGCGLSKLAYQFLGGLKKHAAALVAVSCPTVNSYKRLIKTGSMTGYTWAPIFISYGGNNRTHMFRVPLLRPHIEGRARRWPRQSLQHALGMPRRRSVDESLSRRRDVSRRGARRHRAGSRSRRSPARKHVRAVRRRAREARHQATAEDAARSDHRLRAGRSRPPRDGR